MMVNTWKTVRSRSVVTLICFTAALVYMETNCGFFGNWGPWRKPLFRGVSANAIHDYYGTQWEAKHEFCKCRVKFDGSAGFIATQSYNQYVALQKMSKPGSAPLLVTADAIDSQKKNGYLEDGIPVGYIAKTSFEGSVPLYHLFNASTGDHFYTVDTNERANATTSWKYADEGILGYVWPNGTDPNELAKAFVCSQPCATTDTRSSP